MYNKLLDAFMAVADTGSFTKAANKLFVSHTAVIKQINQLESHLGVKVFKRSNHGVLLTSAGHVLYENTPKLIKMSDDIISKTQAAYFSSPLTIRVGSSVLYPCNSFISIWDKISELCPEFHLQIVPFDDSEYHLNQLEKKYDFLVGAYNSLPSKDLCQFIPVGEYRFTIAMPRKHPLAKKKKIKFSDLCGENIMIMDPGNSPINDSIRNEITENYPDIRIENILSHYNFSTFNNCAEKNSLLLSLECWHNVHPELVSIPLAEDYALPFGIIASKNIDSNMKHFIEMVQKVLSH